MTQQTTTKPMRSRAQWRFLFANGMPFAKRWAHATPGGKGTRYQKLPAKVSKKMLPIVLKAPNYGARAGQTIGGRLVRGSDGKFSSSGAAAPAKPAKRVAPKPKRAPAKTPAQRQAERDAARRDTRDAVLAQLGIDPGASEALVMLSNGEQPQPEALARMGAEAAGLVERAADGSYRMTPAGRQLLNAAERGDKGLAGDVISRARDRIAAQGAKPPKAAGGGGGGKKKPEKPPKLPARQSSQAPKPVGGSGAVPKPAQPKPSAPTTDPALAALAQRLSAGEALTDDEQDTLIRNGLARLVKGELVLTQAGSRSIRGKAYELDTGTRRAPAQRVGASSRIRERLRTRHDGPQPADADRQAGRTARQDRTKAKQIAPTRTTDAGHTGVMVALYPDQAAAKAIATADGVTEPVEQLHLTLCFLGDSTEQPLVTNKDKVIAAIAQWATEKGHALKGVVNGLGRFFHSESDDTNAVYVAPDVPGLPELRQSLAEWIEASGFDYSQDHGFTPHITVAYVPLDAPTPPIRVETPISFDRVTLAWGDEQYEFPMGTAVKSFHVYKDATGSYRWVAYSSNAYRDRDEEIVSTKALTDDCVRADQDGQFGPLRWWHVPGWELGQADFNAMHGRVLVESGTFKSDAIARAVAQAAPDLQLSIGFTHAPDEPDRQGVFHHIKRFERSLVPGGRAANPFTRLIVKESRMDTEKEQALKATLGTEAAAQILAGAEAVQKDADDRQTAYKSADDPWTALGAQLAQTIKAALAPAEAVAEKATPPMVEEEEAVEVIEEQAMEPMVEEVAAEMSADEFLAQIGALIDAKLAPIAGLLDIEKKVAGHVQNLMQPYQAQKDASDAERQQEIATLKGAIDAAQKRLLALEGDVPSAFKIGDGFSASTDDETLATKEITDQLNVPSNGDTEWNKVMANIWGPATQNGLAPA